MARASKGDPAADRLPAPAAPRFPAAPARRPRAAASLPAVRGVDPYLALLADSRCPNTEKSRKEDIRRFCIYLADPDPSRACRLFLSGTAAQANALAMGFKRDMADLGNAAATVNRRLASLRRLVKLGRRLGLIDWELEVDVLPTETYRDTAGPGHDGWLRMLAFAADEAAAGSAVGARSVALLRLMHDCGLRAAEVLALDLADVDLAGDRVAVVGKGRKDREWITINAPTAAALAGWLAHRGDWPGPAFVHIPFDTAIRAPRPGARRMSYAQTYNLIRDIGNFAGVFEGARPHGLRHSGATRLLELTNGDVRAVQKWTRHKNVQTVIVYDDNRRDLAGDLSRRLGEDD